MRRLDDEAAEVVQCGRRWSIIDEVMMRGYASSVARTGIVAALGRLE